MRTLTTFFVATAIAQVGLAQGASSTPPANSDLDQIVEAAQSQAASQPASLPDSPESQPAIRTAQENPVEPTPQVDVPTLETVHPAPASTPAAHPVQQLALTSAVTKSVPLTLGLELGESSGVSISYPLLADHEVGGFVGYSPYFQALAVRADYTYRFLDWVPLPGYGVNLTFFSGAGARLGLFEPRPVFSREIPFSLGARIPLGVAASVPPTPAELAVVVSPGLDVVPDVRFRLEAALALRFRVDVPTGWQHK